MLITHDYKSSDKRDNRSMRHPRATRPLTLLLPRSRCLLSASVCCSDVRTLATRALNLIASFVGIKKEQTTKLLHVGLNERSQRTLIIIVNDEFLFFLSTEC